MSGLYEGRGRTGMQWRTYRHSGLDENLTFVDAKTGETCTLFDCIEKGNLEEQIVTHKIDMEKCASDFAGLVLWPEKNNQYKEKFLKCSKCDRKHTMKKQRKWNNTQRNKSHFHTLADAIDARHCGEMPIEKIYDMIKEMEDVQ